MPVCSVSPLTGEHRTADNVISLFAPKGVAAPMTRNSMTFAEVARSVHLHHYRANITIIQKLRCLHLTRAMPLPDNFRFICGRAATGADSIGTRSLWNRARFMAWRISILGDAQETPIALEHSRGLLAQNAKGLIQ